MNKIGLILLREFFTRVRKPSFLIMTILGPVLIAAGITLTVYLGMQDNKEHHVLVLDQAGIIGTKLQGSTDLNFFVDHNAWTDSAFKASPYTVMVEVNEDILNTNTVLFFYKDLPSLGVQRSISNELEKTFELAKLRGEAIDEEAYRRVRKPLVMKLFDIEQVGEESFEQERAGVGFFFGYFMFIFIFLYGMQVMRVVMEEKQNRIVEVLISSVKPFQLMMGKILGIASVAVLQFVIWMVIIFVGGSLVMQFMMPSDLVESAAAISAGTADMAAMEGAGVDPELAAMLANATDVGFLLRFFGSFLLYFLGGYLLYAAMFAAVGSAVDNVQDSQQFQTPITMPIIIGLVVMMFAMKEPHAPLSVWCSMIPFTSPIVMMARLPFDVPMWELLLSLAILAATFILMVWIAAKIYRIGIFMHGRKPSYKELWQWIRMKD